MGQIIREGEDEDVEMLRTGALVGEALQGERVSKGGKSFLKEHFPSFFLLQDVDWNRVKSGALCVQEPAVQAGRIVANFFKQSSNAAMYRIHPREGYRSSYSEWPAPHTSLGLDAYSHITSPLRRMPDIILQRLLTDALWHNKAPSYSETELSEMAEYFSSSYLQFLNRLQARQHRYSTRLEGILKNEREVSDTERDKFCDKIKDGDITKYDVFRVLETRNGHDSNLSEMQIEAFRWLSQRPHVLNDFVHFVNREQKKWTGPNYDTKNGIVIGKMKIDSMNTVYSKPYDTNDSNQEAKNAAFLDLLSKLLEIENSNIKEVVIFDSSLTRIC